MALSGGMLCSFVRKSIISKLNKVAWMKGSAVQTYSRWNSQLHTCALGTVERQKWWLCPNSPHQAFLKGGLSFYEGNNWFSRESKTCYFCTPGRICLFGGTNEFLRENESAVWLVYREAIGVT